MGLSPKQVRVLVDIVARTKEDEMDCDTCLDRMAEFAENELAGQPVSAAMQIVREHLDFCPECCEEYLVLLEALKALELPV